MASIVNVQTSLNQNLTAGVPFTVAFDTGAGSNLGLIAIVCMNANPAITAISFNSVAIPDNIGTTSMAGAQTIHHLGLVNPTSGSHTFSLTLDADRPDVDIILVSVKDINQTGGSTTWNGYASAASDGISATVSVNVTSGSTNDLVLDTTLSITDDHSAFGASQTNRWEDNTGSVNTAGSDKAGASGTVAVSDTWTAAGPAGAHVVTAFNITGVGGGATAGLFQATTLSGLGAGGPFFANPLEA